jgi:hypothetical protein
MPERKPYPRGIDKTLARQLDVLRKRGYAGGDIPLHRSLLTMAENRGRMFSAAFISIGFILLWMMSHETIMLGWARIIAWCWAKMGLNGYVIMGVYDVENIFYFQVPLLRSAAAPFGRDDWIVGLLLTLVTVIISLFCRGKMTPYGYLLRAAAFVQVVALTFFAFIPEHFPYSMSGYFEVMMIAGFFLLPLVPVLLGFIFYIFDHSLLARIGLTAMILVHFFLFIPLQFTAHAVVMYHGSELWMPLLFLVFGLPLDVLLFIVFYSWGMSWEGTLVNASDRAPIPRTLKAAMAKREGGAR